MEHWHVRFTKTTQNPRGWAILTETYSLQENAERAETREVGAGSRDVKLWKCWCPHLQDGGDWHAA